MEQKALNVWGFKNRFTQRTLTHFHAYKQNLNNLRFLDILVSKFDISLN